MKRQVVKQWALHQRIECVRLLVVRFSIEQTEPSYKVYGTADCFRAECIAILLIFVILGLGEATDKGTTSILVLIMYFLGLEYIRL